MGKHDERTYVAAAAAALDDPFPLAERRFGIRRVDRMYADINKLRRAIRAEGTDEAGEPIDVVDPLAAELVPRAQRSRTDPLAFVADPELFGTLAQDPLFTTPYLSALESLRSKGTRATLIDLLA